MLCLGLALAGCAQEERTDGAAPQILAIGDSLLAWNRSSGRSIADEVERMTGRTVIDRSVIGARILPAFSIVGVLKGPITQQYVPGNWDWVIVSGGGNDLWWGCGCTRCDARIGDLISSDGRTGAVPALVARLRATGARVIWLGYPHVPDRHTPVDHCRDIGGDYADRLGRMAERDPRVFFLSNRDLVPAGDLSLVALDRIHPSPKGSAAIAERIAATIMAAE